MVIRCPSLPLFPLLFIHHSRFPLDALFPSHSTLIFAIPVGWLHVSANNTLSSCNYFANLYPIPSSTHRHRPFTPHSRILNPFSLFSTITQASIKYTFVGGPRTVTVAGYLFSSNCNFSNTYQPPDKCARLFLTRMKNTMSACTAFLEISPRPRRS